jgi:hypothetical protein
MPVTMQLACQTRLAGPSLHPRPTFGYGAAASIQGDVWLMSPCRRGTG